MSKSIYDRDYEPDFVFPDEPEIDRGTSSIVIKGTQIAITLAFCYLLFSWFLPETHTEKLERVCRDALQISVPQAEEVIELCISGEVAIRTVFAADNITPLYDEYADGRREYR